MTPLIVVGGRKKKKKKKKGGATCSPLFTLLRDDVRRGPAPHVALPGNMKGSEQEDLQWPQEQTAARGGPETCQNQRRAAPWRTPTQVREAEGAHLRTCGAEAGFYRGVWF